MVTLAETVRFDLIEMIQDDPTTFQFAGSEFTGCSSGINKRRVLEIGGFEDIPELTIAINLKNAAGDNQFGQDRPKPGDRITVGVTDYRVERTEIDSFEECLQIDLRSKDK